MEISSIAVYGSGSYGQEVFCLIQKINSMAKANDLFWNCIGFFDDNSDLWNTNNGYGIIHGGIDALNAWNKPLSVAVAIANVSALIQIVSRINNPLIDFPNIIDPDTSFLDIKTINIGKGNIIGEGCRLAPKVSIGDFNVIVNDSIFGHDVSVGNSNVFYPDVRLSGHVTVGNGNVFGVRTTILQGINIGSNIKIASGSFLMNNAIDGFVYAGNPARKMKL
jgi:acetyltransferase-like isoleucine patch superfamily enzyme